MDPESQKALLQVWATDIGHIIDDNNSPKAEFARLAKAKGWTGGGIEWCQHWATCFNETYMWGAGNRSITTEPTVNKNLTAEGSALDIADRIRSLSIGSDASSFSVISRTSRANSFDSVRSLNSNQSHEDEDFPANPRPQSHADTSDSIDLQHSVLSLNTVKSLEELSGGVEILDDDRSNLEDIATDDSDAESEEFSGESHENPAWDEFTNFVHRPSASFKSEFERLARIKGWTGRTKRQYLVELLSTEVEFFWDLEDTDKLEHYQFLCQEMGIKQMPLTITQARNALRPLKVNLYSVIDHMRNPEIKIITYKTMRELIQSVHKYGTFPRQCAKAGGGYMAALLSRL